MLVKPTTAPTERSIPAVMMTKVSPIARMAIIAPCRNKLVMLLAVQNVVVLIASAIQIKARSPSRVRPNSDPIRALRVTAAFTASFSATLIAPCLPRSICRLLSRPDRLHQDGLGRRLVAHVACHQPAAAKDVQRIG